MRALIEFLRIFSPMLRSGKMSYGDALTRFRAQFGRPAEGVEKAAIMKEVEKAPSNIVELFRVLSSLLLLPLIINPFSS